jgi:hypothetical protein
MIDPRHSEPVGGGDMKSDAGHKKYVLVKDMASRFKFRYRPSLGPSEMIGGAKEECFERR